MAYPQEHFKREQWTRKPKNWKPKPLNEVHFTKPRKNAKSLSAGAEPEPTDPAKEEAPSGTSEE